MAYLGCMIQQLIQILDLDLLELLIYSWQLKEISNATMTMSKFLLTKVFQTINGLLWSKEQELQEAGAQ